MVAAISNITNHATYVLPISDNGGSTSEILRVLGGIGASSSLSIYWRLIHQGSET